jgi:hypothetical protein
VTGQSRNAWALSLGALMLACSAEVGKRDHDKTPPSVDGQDRPETAACNSGVSLGTTPLRRLSRAEYDNTVFDLLGDDTKPAQTLPDEGAAGFDTFTGSNAVSQLGAERYVAVAEQVAAGVVTRLSSLFACDFSADAAACGAQFVATFGKKLWRRALSNEELASLGALYQSGLETIDAMAGVEMVTAALLNSPHFIYRLEFGKDSSASVGPLSDTEVASRLSYLLWRSAPDDALLERADSGGLSDASAIATEARSMLTDPRSHRTVADFHSQWLGYAKVETKDKDAGVFPEYTPEIALAMKAETNAFIEAVFWETGSLTELFTSTQSFRTSTLDAFYGESTGAGAELGLVNLDPAKRAGLLTQGAVLLAHSRANQTSPVARGLLVRRDLLCDPPNPPPANLNIVLPVLDPNLSTRERFAQHSADQVCKTCHQFMDPLGLGFEAYDAVGRYRDNENGQPIDVSGEVVATDNPGTDYSQLEGPFNGVAQLGQKLAESPQVKSCMTTQWFRYAYGRAETEADACSFDTLAADFADHDYDLRELVVALTQTDAFLYRNSEGATP